MGSRDQALDGVRGLAALGVAGGHSILSITYFDVWGITYSTTSSHQTWEIGARLGYLLFPSDASVMLFFVLSGHVLWSMFDRRYVNLISLPRCVVERLWRLLPTSIAAGLLFGLASKMGFVSPIQLAELLKTMFILSRATNGVIWSLQVEIVCSIVLFVIWAISPNWPSLKLFWAAVFALIYYETRSEYALYMPVFIAGSLVATLPSRISKSFWLPVFGIPVLVSSSFFVGHDWEARVLESLGAFVIIAHARAVQPRWLRAWPVQLLGEVSYPFYLLHVIGLGIGIRSIAWIPGDQMTLQILALFVMSSSIALLLAWIVHRVVERPAMTIRVFDVLKSSLRPQHA